MKSQRQVNYEGFRAKLIKSGLERDLFPLNGAPPIESLDVKIREIKSHNPNLRILLGDINFYAEKILLVTSKKTLKSTHKIFATETRRYWCQTVGIEPRSEYNQGKRESDDEDKKSYGTNCLLTIEQSIKLFCCYLRFRLNGESKTPLEEFEDVSAMVLLNFLENSKKESVWALDDTHLGKILVVA